MDPSNSDMQAYPYIINFSSSCYDMLFFFFFQAEDGIRDVAVTGVQTCALPIFKAMADEQPRARLGHGLDRFFITMHTRRGRPAELQRLELGRELQNAILADVERDRKSVV